MSGRASREVLLGKLVDRAVSMPYAKPQRLRRGHRIARGECIAILDDVLDGARFLHQCFQEQAERSADDGWSTARLIADPAGPWWSELVDAFRDASELEKTWVLDQLVRTAALAGEALQESAIGERWLWLWSQPALATPGFKWPTITRPDLVAELPSRELILIDLKTTSTMAASPSGFAMWKRGFEEGMGFKVSGCWRLVVHVVERQANWEAVTVP